jgi:capsid protein
MSSMDSISGGQLFPDSSGWADPRDYFSEIGPYGFADAAGPALARRDNRLTGEILPVAINWFQLKQIRDRCRMIARNNEYAIAALNACKAYVVGTGFKYKAVARRERGLSDQVLEQVQDILDLFVEHNRLSEVEAEIVYRLHVEGEAFLRVFPGENGIIQIRFIEPELIRAPSDTSASPEDSFGIKCHPEDMQERIGYWVIERPWISLTPELVPAEEIIHLRNNVESNSKRGLPTIMAVETNLRAAEDVLASMIALAKTRAKIGMIRTVDDAPPQAVEELVKSAGDGSITDKWTGRQQTVERFGYGTVLTASGNVKYEFPSLAAGANDLIEILKVNLRAIAGRFGLSEIMMSADAGGANYASSLTAEAPATKSFERFQNMLMGALGTRRTRPERALAWKQLSHAAEMGLIDPDLLQQISIQVLPPTIQARDKAAEANTHKAYMDMGAISLATVRADIGVDDKKEQAQIDQERQKQQKEQMNNPLAPPGQGGLPQGPAPGGKPPQGVVDGGESAQTEESPEKPPYPGADG